MHSERYWFYCWYGSLFLKKKKTQMSEFEFKRTNKASKFSYTSNLLRENCNFIILYISLVVHHSTCIILMICCVCREGGMSFALCFSCSEQLGNISNHIWVIFHSYSNLFGVCNSSPVRKQSVCFSCVSPR